MKSRKTCPIFLVIPLLFSLWGCSADAGGALTASGFAEGETYHLIAPHGGTIDFINVSLGESVETNQVVLQFDTEDVDSQLAQAQAGEDHANSVLNALAERPADDQVAQAQSNLDLAELDLSAAQTSLELLKSFYEPLNPPSADQHRAEYAVQIARAEVDLAQAMLDQAMAGPLQMEWDIAEAGMAESEAQIDLIEWQRKELTIRSPIGGVVSQLLVKSGEIVSPGTTLVHILDPSDLHLTVYIPVGQVTGIEIGDRVRLETDSYPGETFDGRVTKVADQAQFTPTLVLTAEERVKLVFAIEVKIESGLERLKPGMPIDAEF